MDKYKKAGVNILTGDICSKIMATASDRTFKNRKGRDGEIKILERKGLYRVIAISIGSFKLMLNSDGIGTKVEVGERVGTHKTMAYDLFAMLCDDAVRYGAEPVALSNILDVNKLSVDMIKELSDGMVKAAREAGVAVVSGEIAEIGCRISGYGRYNYNWAGTVLSVIRKEMSPEMIKKGQYIVALGENGFRSNGISLVRKILKESYGEKWHTKKIGAQELGKMVLTPSKIYTPAVLDMFGFVDGIAHITGGGIPVKLGRVLSSRGLGAVLTDLFPPPEIALICQRQGGVSDKEAYSVWNMGQGMLIVTSYPEKVIDIADRYRIRAKIVGEITDKKGISLISQGYYQRGQVLLFE